MFVGLYSISANPSVVINVDGDNLDMTEFSQQPRRISQRENDMFYYQAVSASDSVSPSVSKTYQQQVEIWAKEFQYRKHHLTHKEIEAQNSEFILDLLENQNSLP